MFACESMLKNSNIATLEMFNNQPRWWIKDAILTERAFYLFQEKGDLLGDEYDKLEMTQFRSQRVLNDDSVVAPPPYIKQLPPFKLPFTHIIEMHNKKTQKRRILACENAAQAEEYVNLMNLVNSYLNYELLFSQEDYQVEKKSQENPQNGDQNQQNQPSITRKSGPTFITNWVQAYNSHQGCMEFKEECFDPQNFPYLLSFGRENDSIKSLIFPGESVLFAGNEQHWMSTIQQVLSTFSRDSVTSIIMRGNFMVDQVLKSIIPSMAQYERLVSLEISNNGLSNASLESLGIVFSNCPFITKVNLSNNLLGSGGQQSQALELFLTHLLTELDNPQQLDLSNNQFTDESLMPFIKFIFANEECKLQLFNLENNIFSSYGKRTLLKGYALCSNKQSLQFKCGPMPFTESTLKHAFNITYETKTIQTGKNKEPEQQKVLKSMNKDKLEIKIVRKPNYGGQYLKGLPINKQDRDKLHSIFAKIENTVHQRHNIFIEDIRDLLLDISQLSFEFPRHKLESLFDVVNEKLYQSMECENIYCLEILLDCLRFMNARNIKAEEKYQELSIVAAGVAKDLLKVINMELLDDNELNAMLDQALNEARRIGMRGEIIDVAITLKMLRNNFLTEMQNKSANSDDEGQGMGDGDHHQLEYYDEDKTLNVYDEKYDQYIDSTAEELGLTSEVEPNLGFHPYDSDYLKISNLNLNYVKKNLKEAQKFLRDEESYAYRNIFDRCYFLLCDSTEEVSASSKAYNLAKNDTNLKLARIIFRYRNGLDSLFPPKLEPYPGQAIIKSESEMKRRPTLLPNSIKPPSDENKIQSYKYLLNKDYLEFNGTKLTHPITKIDKNKAVVAVGFNRCLFGICETDDFTKNTLYARIQELFEEFVVKKSRLINEDLTDEFYLQIYRQINRKNLQQSEKSARAIANALFILALFSRYTTPSKDLVEGMENWLNQLRERSGAEFYRLIQLINSNFNIVKRVDTNTKTYCYWAPCFAEIESIITGEPIQIQVYSPIGDVYQYTVDELTTVESLLQQHIWKEKFFAKEPDQEFYWLYQHVDRGDQFDQPLSKDKRILKLLYKNEKTQGLIQRQSVYKDNQFSHLDDPNNSMNSSFSPDRKYSFIKKKSAKFMRKKTLFAANIDTLQENEYQSTILLVRKRLFTALHLDKNVKTLAKKPLNFLYHQVRMDYIEKNILRRLCNYEDVSLFAALILKVKYWGKILRSKDNSLTKELIIKNIDYAIPQTFMREKSQDYWVQKIQRDFDRHNLRELSIEEAQERFLSIFAQYNLAFSTYYVMRATPIRDSSSIDSFINNGQNPNILLRQFDLDETDDFISPSHLTSGGGHTFKNTRESFLNQHMNNDLLCVVNFNGIIFYENQKRDKVIQKIQFDELLYVMGSNDTLRIGFVNKGQLKSTDIKIDIFTTNGQNSRLIAEDIVAYCQVRLAECSKNDMIEIVKRNIINIFEDLEDPFAAGGNGMDDMGLFDISQTSPDRNRSNNNTYKRQATRTGGGTADKFRQSNIGAFEFLGGDYDYSQGGSPDNKLMESQINLKQIQQKLNHQRGNQFRFREKILIYLKRYPLYMSKQMQASPSRGGNDLIGMGGATSNLATGFIGNQHRNTLMGRNGSIANKTQLQLPSTGSSGLLGTRDSNSGSSQNTNKDRQSMLKLQLASFRIEEDKEEDEDDSNSVKEFTNDDYSDKNYSSSGAPGNKRTNLRNQSKNRGANNEIVLGKSQFPPLSNKSGGDLSGGEQNSSSKTSPLGTSSNKFGYQSQRNAGGNISESSSANNLINQQQQQLQNKSSHRESVMGTRSGFSFKQNAISFASQNTNNGGRKDSELMVQDDDERKRMMPKTPVREEINSNQMAVINELFKSKSNDEEVKQQAKMSSNLLKRLEEETRHSPTRSDLSDTLPDQKEPTMVLGQKVNYDEMDKEKKKENLNSILSAAFNFMPPPPPK